MSEITHQDLMPLARAIRDTKERLDTTERRLGTSRSATRAAWKDVALTNSWANRSGCETFSYTLDNDGTVHMRGVIQSGTSGTSAYTLPASCRPTSARTLPAAASGGLAKVVVGTDGTVRPYSLTGSAVGTWVSLSGLSFDRLDYAPGSTVMRNTALAGDSVLPDPVPTARMHLGGLVMTNGIGQTTSTPSASDELYNVAHELGCPWSHLLTTIGNDELTRLDIFKNHLDWIAGNAAATFLSFAGVEWPSLRLWESRAAVTLASGVTQYSPGAKFTPEASVFKDDAGRCWVGCIVNLTNLAAGDDVFTLPVEYRPQADLIIPAINSNISRGLRIKTTGVCELENAAISGWIAVSSGFWPDNG